jgi:lipid-binding SYLF domain-containing protein
MRRFLIAVCLAFVGAWLWLSMPLASAASPSSEDALLSGATTVFRRVAETSSTAIPAVVLRHAKAIAVIPGARHYRDIVSGTGIVSARGLDSLDWSLPAAIEFQGKLNPPLDVDSSDIVLVAVADRGVQLLTNGDGMENVFETLPRGPLDDMNFDSNADVVAYVQFGDFFAGMTTDDLSICDAPIVNTRLYGMAYAARDIFHLAGTKASYAVEEWRAALSSYFRQTS